MEIFNLSETVLENSKATFTAKEIVQQPITWRKTLKQVNQIRHELTQFIEKTTKQNDFDIILTGAGTSEFVGNSVYSYLNRLYDYKVKSYATTDLTASPENFISAMKPTLLVSYGRSGDSPESIGAIQSVEAVNPEVHHLFITCNQDGALSLRASKEGERCFAINLSPETLDQSFAMTSSYSNMYLATLLAFAKEEYETLVKSVESLATNVEKWLLEDFYLAKEVVEQYPFERIVYLGTNTQKGVAQESALKMLELTAGKVVTMFDTPLGFRHGPKSIIDDTTLTVLYLSDYAYQRQYELDLLKEMAVQRKGNKILAVANIECSEAKELADWYYCFNGEERDNVVNGLAYITVAQLVALFKSLSLSITPDNPCPTGEVNRVVKGVTLYPYSK
ncbi:MULTISPECIES: SIS domain-containing protein [Terrabacteria group]|uniref:SIS domain-containing protein n=1 Tax=Bacillati TaxID=1783272 RepID=UPI001C6E89DF|nr:MULTISPECIES: SIS domain-containing protein [Terrabacteria group]MBW9213095.1 SIS domain-containing protein [Trueperella sp. zg.1013]